MPNSSSPLPSIPVSTSTVSIKLLDTGPKISGVKTSVLFEDPVPGYDSVDLPSYAFLVEHKKSGARILFDLGLRRDWEEGVPPFVTSYIRKFNWSISFTSPDPNTTTTNTRHDTTSSSPSSPSSSSLPSLLTSHSIPPTSISALIWSHHHWDHVGDPSLFPVSIPLLVGPGFKSAYLPGYPSNPKGEVNSLALEGREILELDFDSPLPSTSKPSDSDHSSSTTASISSLLLTSAPRLDIAGLRAIDLFADGSFYLLDAPGHTVGHLCALARTGPSSSLASTSSSNHTPSPSPSSEFILLAADAFHHPGELRPNIHSPLPASVIEKYNLSPESLERMKAKLDTRPQSQSDETADSTQDDSVEEIYTHPLFTPHAHTPSLARDTLAKLGALDARNDVLSLSAHEGWVEGEWQVLGKGDGYVEVGGWRREKMEQGKGGGGEADRTEEEKDVRERNFWGWVGDLGGEVRSGV